MAQIKRIPIELLRQLPRKNQADYIAKYHALCTEKYDWYVRERNGGAYYANGERPELAIGDTAFDCNWTPEQWHTRPYMTYIHEGNGSLYEHYARFGLEPLSIYHYGWKREDSLVMKDGEPIYYGMYRHNGDNLSAHWWVGSGDIWITYNDSQTNYYGASDKHTQGATFSTVADVKKPAIEPVMKAAKAMNVAKYKGVYKPFINRLVELYGLNETQI